MNPTKTFTMLHDLVMVFPLAKAKTTSAGIIIKESIDATAPIEGFIVGAGPGKLDKNGNLIPMPVKAGDKIIFVTGSARPVKRDGDTFLVVPVSEILCKIENEATT